MLPFAGELIQVKASEEDWRPAAERLLGGFATSMLVPDDLYPDVADWIDRNHLKARLTYYRVIDGRTKKSALRRGRHPLMFDKLDIKASEFSEWLEAELEHRAGHECCESIEDFRRSGKAVTLRGQIKSPGDTTSRTTPPASTTAPDGCSAGMPPRSSPRSAPKRRTSGIDSTNCARCSTKPRRKGKGCENGAMYSRSSRS
ncbi:hypothetical protein GCM10029992_07340 [Glycomyces albus]